MKSGPRTEELTQGEKKKGRERRKEDENKERKDKMVSE